MTDNQLTIPGLEDPADGRTDPPMVVAARTTLQALRDADQLQPRHAVLVALVLELAHAVAAGSRSGRASAAAMAAAQLRETMLVLDPPPESPGVTDARALLAQFVQDLENLAPDQGHRATVTLLDGSEVRA